MSRTQRENDSKYCSKRLSGRYPSQLEHIPELTQEVRRRRSWQSISEKVFDHQQEEFAKFNAKLTSTTVNCRWLVCDNLNIFSDQSNILEHAGNAIPAFAQLHDALTAEKPYFKIHILDLAGTYNSIVVGLTRRAHPIHIQPGHNMGSIGYRSNGIVNFDGESEAVRETCSTGDIIECGIRFLLTNEVEVYFLRNGRLITKRIVQMPEEGLYPTVGVTRIHADTIPMLEVLA